MPCVWEKGTGPSDAMALEATLLQSVVMRVLLGHRNMMTIALPSDSKQEKFWSSEGYTFCVPIVPVRLVRNLTTRLSEVMLEAVAASFTTHCASKEKPSYHCFFWSSMTCGTLTCVVTRLPI